MREKNHLKTLHLSNYIMFENTVPTALSTMYKRILSLSRQVPLSHRDDAYRIEFLRSAVIEYEWSKETLSQISTNNLTFQELYAKLEISVQLHRENRAAARRDQTTLKLTLQV